MKLDYHQFAPIITGIGNLQLRNELNMHFGRNYLTSFHKNFPSLSLKHDYIQNYEQADPLDIEMKRNEEIRLRKKQKKKEKKLRKRERVRNKIKAEQENHQCILDEQKENDSTMCEDGISKAAPLENETYSDVVCQQIDIVSTSIKILSRASSLCKTPQRRVLSASSMQVQYVDDVLEKNKHCDGSSITDNDRTFSLFTSKLEILGEEKANFKEYTLFGPNERNRNLVWAQTCIQKL